MRSMVGFFGFVVFFVLMLRGHFQSAQFCITSASLDLHKIKLSETIACPILKERFSYALLYGLRQERLENLLRRVFKE